MPEKESGFNPEDNQLEHDVTDGYLNNSEPEFMDYLAQFDPADRLVLNLNAPDVNPPFIKQFLTKFSAAKVNITCDQSDADLLRKYLPYSSVQFTVKE